MASKRFKIGLLVSIVAIILCVGFALITAQPIFGLDFSDGYLVRINLKKDFDATDVLSLLQPIKKDLGDVRVSKTGSGEVAQALIYVQHADDATQSAMITALEKEYPEATLRSANQIKTQKSKMALLSYALFLLLGIALVGLYCGIRKSVSAGTGIALAAVLSILVSLAVSIVCAIPLNVSSMASCGAVSLASLALFYIVLSQNVDAEEEDIQLGAKNKMIVIIGMVFILLTSIALFILGGIGMRSFAATMCIGLLVGMLEAAFVALPYTVLYKDKFRRKVKQKSKKRVKI